jgi:hypothetical protein
MLVLQKLRPSTPKDNLRGVNLLNYPSFPLANNAAAEVVDVRPPWQIR